MGHDAHLAELLTRGFVPTDHTVLYHLGPLNLSLPKQTLHRSRVCDDLRRIRKQAGWELKIRLLSKVMLNYKFLILSFYAGELIWVELGKFHLTT